MPEKSNKSLSPFIPAAGSFLIMGLGQLFNKNWMKALMFFLVPVLILTIEFSSSTWYRYFDLVSGKADAQVASQTIDYSLEKSAIENTEITYSESASSLADMLGLGATSDEDYSDESMWEEDLWGSDSSDEDSLWGSETAESDMWSDDSSDESLWGDDLDFWGAVEDIEGEESGISYFDYEYEYPNYAYSPNGEKYLIRDFGGFFTKGIWGLVTLGKLVIGDEYAGKYIELYNKISGWLTADNSTLLLGNGLITLVIIIICMVLWIVCILDAYSERKIINAGGEKEPVHKYLRRLWQDAYVYIIISPALILILIFTLVPFLFTFLLAFTNYTYKVKLGSMLIKWSGFQAFKLAVVDSSWLSIFSQIFLWTVFWAVMSSFTVYALGFINALVVESPLVKGKKIWRMVLILPWAIPGLISLMLFKNVFDTDGLMNQFLFASGLMEPVSNFLHAIGLQGKADQPIYWFKTIYNGNLAKAIVVFVNLWLGAPYHMMLIIGVISTIPRELYEAADMDGATGFQRFKSITLPMVLSSTIPSLIMTFSFNFNNFGAVYFLTGGGPMWDPTKVPESMRIIGSSMPGQTDILISWIYKLSFTKATEMFNVAAVYSIIIFAIIGSFSVWNLMRSKSFTEDGE